MIIADRHRLLELEQVIKGRVKLEARVTRWFDAAADIRALRKLAMDGPLAVEGIQPAIVGGKSLSVATVKNDNQGNTSPHGEAETPTTWRGMMLPPPLVLVAGLQDRASQSASSRYHGMIR